MMVKKLFATLSAMLVLILPHYLFSQRTLTLEQSIQIALDRSYQAKQLQQSLISSRKSLEAAKASFKSNGQLLMSSFPNFQQSERQTPLQGGGFSFDRQKFMNLQAELFVNQPIARTDGTFSLVGVLQRFQQFGRFENIVFDPETNLPVLNPATGEPQLRIRKDPSEYSPNLRLQFRQPLFTLNRLKTGLKKAELNLENTVQTYTRRELDLVYQVTTSFYGVFRAQQQLVIDRQQVAQSEEALRTARLKHQAGLLPELQVLQLDVELANARNRAAAGEANLEAAKDAFKVLIGLPIEEDIRVLTDLNFKPIEVSQEKALSEALHRRTELESDENNIELSRLNVEETDALSEVRGELFLSYGVFNRREKFADAFQDFSNDRRVSFSLSVPLWDWGKNAAEVEAAMANLENQRLAKRNRIEQIKQEIRAAVRNFKSAAQRVEITRRSETLAEKSYRISLLKFENGDLSSQELALEQNRLTQARTNSLSAVIDYQQALADLRRKTLWDFEKNEPVRVRVPEEE